MSTIKPAPPEPQTKPSAEEHASVIDTSKMTEGQRAALELTEAPRDAAGQLRCESDRAHLRPSVHRRAPAADPVRHRGTEKEVPPTRRQRRDLRLRPHRTGC